MAPAALLLLLVLLLPLALASQRAPTDPANSVAPRLNVVFAYHGEGADPIIAVVARLRASLPPEIAKGLAMTVVVNDEDVTAPSLDGLLDYAPVRLPNARRRRRAGGRQCPARSRPLGFSGILEVRALLTLPLAHTGWARGARVPVVDPQLLRLAAGVRALHAGADEPGIGLWALWGGAGADWSSSLQQYSHPRTPRGAGQASPNGFELWPSRLADFTPGVTAALGLGIVTSCSCDGCDTPGRMRRVVELYALATRSLCPPWQSFTTFLQGQFIVSRASLLRQPRGLYQLLHDMLEAPAGHWIHDDVGVAGGGDQGWVEAHRRVPSSRNADAQLEFDKTSCCPAN